MVKNIMNTKNLVVSFVAIVMALFIVATVSAIDITDITVDGINTIANPALVAGETVTVKVYFTAELDEDLSEVVVKVELGDNSVKTSKFDIEDGESYRKVLNIKVPYDFDDDELSTKLDFEVTIEGEDSDGDEVEEEFSTELTVQRPSYNVDIKPIHVPSSVEAGETFSVDVVVENDGYNDLDDLYITARIPELDVEEIFYIGDLTTVDDDDSTLHKRLTLKVPYDAKAGEYTLEVEVSNEEATIMNAIVVVTENSLPNQVIKTDTGLIIINPTDKMAVYTVVAESPASVSERTVIVEDGSSKEVTVTANTAEEFTVSVFSADGKLVSTVTFSESETVNQIQSPIVIMTVVLAIVFLVLLVVLIVLITKKPEKTDEFGESYY